jgi:hypothetical protein
MSQPYICLNCNQPVVNSFCSYCGQKTDTHRITFRHFIFHDILHGIWHFEKGILYTAKQAMIRPGKAALDYIAGKRIRYYNVFYLTLLLIGLNLFISHIQIQLSNHYFNTELGPKANTAGAKIDAFLENYSKMIIFSFIPLFAINSFLIFRKKKLNLSEHFIISGMMFLGVMIITTITSLFYFAFYIEYLDFFVATLNACTPLIILVYLIKNYYTTFLENYTKTQNTLRVCLFISMLIIEITILLTIMVGYFTDWAFKFK